MPATLFTVRSTNTGIINNKPMKNWKNMSGNEKMMIGFMLIMLIAIVLSWSRISKGLEKGLQPYKKNMNTEELK